MEERVGPLTFTSNFDSGNLARVERVKNDENSTVEEVDDISGTIVTPDYEYNVWTKPDCGGTEFENSNRTWFYFGVKGGSPGKVLKINIMNLNRQGKLYAQGMSVVVKVIPGRQRWERIRERPTYGVVDGQFHLSFMYRYPDHRNATHYFAFCYPYSYEECQAKLQHLDNVHISCKNLTPSSPKVAIYYHRELLCHSNDGLRVDLLTITSCRGMMNTREQRLAKLFPDSSTPRPHRFEGKKVFFLSARVHPGETPSSFVFNGFLDFILRKEDPRAAILRDHYVFKMIPVLNPDGVKRGHYRTDAAGINLNRVYLNPDPICHPSIYGAKAVVMYHHQKAETCCICGNKITEGNENNDSHFKSGDTMKQVENVKISPIPPEVRTGSQLFEQAKAVPSQKENNNHSNEITVIHMEEKTKCEGKQNNETKDSQNSHKNSLTKKAQQGCTSNEPNKAIVNDTIPKQNAEECKMCSCANSQTKDGGVAFYVDLHGHASKRGCFVYGNYLGNEDDYVESILLAKLASINSSNFDFTACNFTEKNMYTKDKRDQGLSKEGSGRVAMYKAIGIVHSYTLECNYNCGRMANPVPPATFDGGRATPPPPPGFPPKFTPEIYEEVGRALAISALDVHNRNPWSRLPLSEFTSVDGVRNWVRRFVRSAKNAPSVPRKLSRIVTKTSSAVANAGTNTRQRISLTFANASPSQDNDSIAPISLKQMDKSNAGKVLKSKEKVKKCEEDLTHQRRFTFPLSSKLTGMNTTRVIGKKHECLSSSTGSLRHSPPQPITTTASTVTANLQIQIYKPKEPQRVSLDLPKTRPHLKIVQGILPVKSVAAAPDSKTGLKWQEPQNSNTTHFIGLQNRKANLGKIKSSNGTNSQSDEEKKKKSCRLRGKKATRRKDSKSDSGNETVDRAAARKSVKKDKKLEKGIESGSLNHSRSLVTRKVNKAVSCEVVDITELRHLPTTGSDTSIAYWIDA